MKDFHKKILEASNLIHKAGLKGSANYIIASSEVSNIINEINKKQTRIKKLKRILNEKDCNNISTDIN